MGLSGVRALLDLIRQPSVRGFHRLDLIGSAITAAGDDIVLRSSVAETVREILDQAMIQYRSSIQRYRENREAAVSETLLSDPAEVYPTDEIGLLISHLADLADPLAVELIEAAFDEDLVSLEIINRKNVKNFTRKVVWFRKRSRTGWMTTGSFMRTRTSPKRRSSSSREPLTASRSRPAPATPRLNARLRRAPTRPVQPIVTIRNTTPKIGRNEPCWCGSGKKYKKCHLGKDTAT